MVIKVYIQYPWKFPDSPYYKSLIEFPAKNIEYILDKKQKEVIINKNFFWVSNFLKRNIRRLANISQISFPNAHLSPKGDYDIIHCAHCLSKNKNKPWVADIEMIPSFSISNWNKKRGQKKVKKILLKDNCKKILPWTESVKEEILEIYPKIKDKIEVLYPAIPEVKNLKKKKNKKLRIIFVSRYFDIKGGLLALETLKRLKEKYNIESIVVSDVPKKIREKYPNIKIFGLLPKKDLFELMKDSDIFLYPSAMDTFGFSLLEAMSFGLPIVTINTHRTKSRKEIVENEKTGIIFDFFDKINFYEIRKNEEEIINKLIENCSRLIEDKKLREKMSKECINTIKEGKFSIKERNKKLKRIYEEALK